MLKKPTYISHSLTPTQNEPERELGITAQMRDSDVALGSLGEIRVLAGAHRRFNTHETAKGKEIVPCDDGRPND